MTERRRAAVGVTVAALAVAAMWFAAFSPSDSTRAPVPPPSPSAPPVPHLVALGDSIAAGWAVGGPDHAYPALLAARLRYSVENLAVAGATAGSVLRDQLPRIAAAPEVVTVTVGANDVRYEQCASALFGVGGDPCTGGTYRRNLDRLARDLALLLDRLHARYPRARLLVSRYYDPFPVRAADVCGLDAARFSGGGPVDRTVRRTARRLFQARITRGERTVFRRAAQRLTRLNATIDRVTTAHHGRVVAVDFRGHDLCAIDPWVFAPDVHARLNFRWPGPDYAEDVTYTARLRCTEPCGSPRRFTARYNATVGRLVVSGTFTPNGTPHPDEAGQRAFADAFEARVTR